MTKPGAGDALRNATNGVNAADAVTSSTNAGRGKRKLAFHPTLGYAIPPPQPAKVARRNARERNRVKQVNGGFDVLKSHIPSAAKHKKLSKVETLRHAVEYIQSLQRMLMEQESGGASRLKKETDEEDTTTTVVSNNTAPDDEDSSSCSVSPPHSTTPVVPLSLMQPLQQPPANNSNVHSQYTPPDQVYSAPLTPRTPNTPTDFSGMVPGGGNHFSMGVQQQQPGHESGYETTSYYSAAPQLIGGYHHHQGDAASSNSGGASPSSPSMYSSTTDSSSYLVGAANNRFNNIAPPSGLMPSFPTHHIPSSYYDNSEEDELLDTIVNWQDQQ